MGEYLSEYLAEPTWVHVDDEEDLQSFSVTWAFGPQGHPGSMRVLLVWFEGEGESLPRIWALGPGLHGEHRVYTDQPFKAAVLASLLQYGKKINERWGEDWRWHQCQAGCVKAKCPGCKRLRESVKAEFSEWFERNPRPEMGA